MILPNDGFTTVSGIEKDDLDKDDDLDIGGIKEQAFICYMCSNYR